MQHLLIELKNITPISSTDGGTGEAGAYAAMGNSDADQRRKIEEKYQDAKRRGHEVLPVVHESFGGFNKVAADLLMYLAMRARRKTPAGEEPPWAARSFVPYHSQLISAAVQCEAAEEILDRVGYETDIRQGELNRSG